MNEEDIRKSLIPAFDDEQARHVPDFDKVWANASAAYGDSQRRYRIFGSIAAAMAVAVITVVLWPAQQAPLNDGYFITDALMNSTSWSAPSDLLMPEHQFDIYQEIPFLNESTYSLQGTLL